MCSDRPSPNHHSCKQTTVLQNIERDQIQNRLMQLTMDSAARTMARLQDQVRLFVAQSEVSSSNFQSEGEPQAVNKVSFSNADHPEGRDLVRPGTPAVLQAMVDDDFEDDVDSAPEQLSCSVLSSLYPDSSRPTPDLSQSPSHFVRELSSPEVWEDDGPTILSPVPERPLRSAAHVLMEHVEQRDFDGERSTSPLLDDDLSKFSGDILGRRMGEMVDRLVACYYGTG